MSSKVIPVIISGGSGSRLWPISREASPKPFLRLANGLSLLQNTFTRAISIPGVTNVLTVTNEKLHFRMQDEYQQLLTNNSITCDFILEPLGRNTAPAVATACLFVTKYYSPDDIVLILPADHLINDIAAFKLAVIQAQKLAAQNYVVTFGIQPEYPESGYGYIETDPNAPILNGYKINKFVEKPDSKTAEQYLASGNYLWNSGMFCAKASVFLDQFAEYASELLNLTRECYDNSKTDILNTSRITHLNSREFAKVPNISIDYAVCEKSQHMAVLPCSLGWSDIGSWLSIAETLPKDPNNNAVLGENVLHNTSECVIYSTNRIVAGVDIKDLIIVDTADAVLVANKNSAQNVKIIFEQLKSMHHQTSESHHTTHRPWGTYTVLEEGTLYKIKRIEVKPGAALSLQLHHHRSEHWIVVAGVATVTNGDTVFELCANQSTYIPDNTKHRLENKTMDNLILIEVQCGNYLGEDDIVRFEDVYGRTKT